MRHAKKDNHLGREVGHRRALLANLAVSLIEHKQITTTLAKAKALRRYVEPLISKSKTDTTHSRRTVFAHLHNKESIKTLFSEIAPKIADRPGGYTRILKLGTRHGDAAELALIELVDFNEYLDGGSITGKKAKTNRRRPAKKKAETTAAKPVAPAPVEVAAETPVVVEESPVSEATIETTVSPEETDTQD